MWKKGILGLVTLIWVTGPLCAQVEINYLGLGVSYWHRSYTGADERAFLSNANLSDSFYQTALFPTLSGELNLYNGLALEGRVGALQTAFRLRQELGADRFLTEKVEQTILPLYGGLVYNFRDLIPKYLNAFVGLGISRYFIRNRFTRSLEGGDPEDNLSRDLNGNDYGLNGKLGAEYLFKRDFSLALELRYHYGRYRQQLTTAGESSGELLSFDLKGLEAGINFRYNFSY
ncbi:hypothetical protein [Cyclobacterium sp. SYSU L10401]|uniref:hypothetical protein n=1 Tax=Cyclobacterium sp. SYSU L10401 TaxID=2678657 RepID=UPI0013D6899F|nr:hypothetical protein [Cyclobacterium sp. SYSU L10401]